MGIGVRLSKAAGREDREMPEVLSTVAVMVTECVVERLAKMQHSREPVAAVVESSSRPHVLHTNRDRVVQLEDAQAAG